MATIEQIWPFPKAWSDNRVFSQDPFFSRNGLPTFSSSSVEFLDCWSRGLMEPDQDSGTAEAMALGFWLRKANVERMATTFRESLEDNEQAVPRGVALHIAPANVDAMFAYSLALSILAGNLNIVRVSSRAIPGIQSLLKRMGNWAGNSDMESIIARNMIITYPHDDQITSMLSAKADVRVIWGGTHTVRNILSAPGKETGHDLRFVDKKSLAAIHGERYLALRDNDRFSLAERFYRDGSTYEQMACSSPRLVVVIGDAVVCERASTVFWKTLSEYSSSQMSRQDGVRNMDRLVYGTQLAAQGLVSTFTPPQQVDALVMRVNSNNIMAALESPDFCGGGIYLESHMKSIKDLSVIANRSIQTLTHACFEREELYSLVRETNGAGIDRIVPFGEALTFKSTWDGYPLLVELTRRVSVMV